MSFWVYMLRCTDGTYYVGHTDDLEARIPQHEAGRGADWTARRLPVELVWADHTSSRDEALTFERRLKGWSRAKKEAWIERDYERLGWLSRPPAERAALAARPSTSLRTNGVIDGATSKPFVSSDAEERAAIDHRGSR